MKLLELFGGIGAFSKALRRLGAPFEIVDYVEIDKYAVQSYNAINGTNFQPQDITKWNKNIEADIIMHGSPCQDFSLAGKQAGGDKDSGTRSSLLYETIRIVEQIKPKYVIWENVKNLISKKHKHNFDAYINEMERLGYRSYYKVLNAKDYGIPQNRERVFTISIRNDIETDFKFPEPMPLTKKLADLLEDNVDEKYYLSDKMIDYISATGTENFSNHDSMINLDIARPLTTDQNKRAGTTNYLSEQLPSNYDLKGKSYAREFGSRGKLQEKEVCDTLTATMGTGGGNTPIIKIKNATKQGYLEATAGDGINISARMQYQRGNVQKEMIQTIDTQQDRGVVVDDKVKPSVAKNFEREKEEIANSDKEIYQCKCDSGWQDNKIGLQISPTLRAGNDSTYGMTKNLRIRKLTPKECWRLMGFDDEDFDKAQTSGISNTQLYKQAGNSIVVNVLMEIFKEII